MDFMLKASIQRLRIISLLLFVFSNIAIFGSLFFHNYLTSIKYTYDVILTDEIKPISKNSIAIVKCNKENNFCFNTFWQVQSKKLDECLPHKALPKYYVNNNFITEDYSEFQKSIFDNNKELKSKFLNSDIFVTIELSEKLNVDCLKNYPISYSIYKFFPFVPNSIVDIKLNPNYFDATGKVVNPFVYGETSISNIAKRFPIYFIFKPFLFIASIIMILYWIYTKKVLSVFDKNKRYNSYYYLGILSGIFLFLHVMFLGMEFENEIYRRTRRLFIVFFIFFEISAQFILIRKLFSVKDLIINFINYFFLSLKRFFIVSFLIVTIIITSILIIYNLPKEADYIIEWNYFVILTFYYVFTYFLWKKSTSYPTTT